MTQTLSKLLISSTLVAGISGCGGGGEESPAAVASGSPTLVPVTVANLASPVTVPPGSTKIIGAHGKTISDIWFNQIQLTQGAEAQDGSVTLSDGSSVFTGSGGYINGIQDGDIGTLRRNDASDNFTYGTIYSGAISGGSERYGIFQGVYGKEAIFGPLTVQADYLGTAEAVFARDNALLGGPYSMNNGLAELGVDFASDIAVARFSQFDPTFSPIDTILVDAMTVDGNRFGGGSIFLTKDGELAPETGANTQTAITGMFLGDLSATGVPLEAGGMVYSRGDDGVLSVTFLGKLQ